MPVTIITQNPYQLFPGSSFTVALPGTTQAASSSQTTPDNALAGWKFLADGTVDRVQTTGAFTWIYRHDWGTPTGGSPGSDYDIMCTVNSGTTPSGAATGSWLNLGTDRFWYLTRSVLGNTTCNLTMAIRPTGGGATLDSQTYTIQALVGF